MGFKSLYNLKTKLTGFYVDPKHFLEKDVPILFSPLQSKKAGFGPILCCWRNIRDGTLTYNTIPVIDPKLVYQTNFKQHQTQISPVHCRPDYWEVFYVASFSNYVQAGEIFKSLVALKKMRYTLQIKENKKIRKLSQIDPKRKPSYGLYNPFVQQEGVADLVESLSKSKYLNSADLNGQVTIYWREKENAGDEEKHWKSKTSQIMIEHKTLDLITRDPFEAVLEINNISRSQWDAENEPESVIPQEEKDLAESEN